MPHHPTVVKEANQLFVRFARFEFALKRGGFAKPGRKKDKLTGAYSLMPDWDDFKKTQAVKDLWTTASADKTIQYLIQNPAKIYMSNGTQVGLGHAPPSPTTMATLIDMVLRVRNNLFHGDKQAAGLERDTLLLRSCLSVIDLLLDANGHVRVEYEAPSGP